MNDERITRMPAPSSSHHVTPVATPQPTDEEPGDPALSVGSPEPVWLLGRAIGTVTVAAAFVIVCWLLGGSVFSEQRMLSGPLRAFNTTGGGGKTFAIAVTVLLLPCIFAVGLWRNKATITLSILGCLGWVALSFWFEAMDSV
jgi:hypothetical protein